MDVPKRIARATAGVGNGFAPSVAAPRMDLSASARSDSPARGGPRAEAPLMPESAKRTRGRSKSEQRAETLELILDAADRFRAGTAGFGVEAGVREVVGDGGGGRLGGVQPVDRAGSHDPDNGQRERGFLPDVHA